MVYPTYGVICMDTMGGRLKAVRKEEGLSQTQFGERLGVTVTAISKLEKGENKFTEQMILTICREFNVNEDWLRTGEGGSEAMFEETDEEIIAAVISEYNLDELSRIILKAYVNMSPKKRAAFNGFAQELADRIMAKNIQLAREGVTEAVSKVLGNRNVPDSVKNELYGDILSAFHESFPYIGVGNLEEDEPDLLADDKDRIGGLTEEEAVELVHERYANKKRGLPSSTTSGKLGAG